MPTNRFFGDPLRLAEIVTNLLLNAIRHTPPHGAVHVWYQRDSASVRLSVCDEGPGIAAVERTRIFEDGYRGVTAATGAGSGIGLALVKRFVDSHGGTIAVSDGPRCGAMFILDLPGKQRHTPCGQACTTEPARSVRRP